MPDKFVFPGGAVDLADYDIPVSLNGDAARRLAIDASPNGIGPALGAAAIRELWEETGLMLARNGQWSAPEGWEAFSKTSGPAADALTFFFRAVTPPGRPRRFDARFFLARAEDIANDLDDFSAASDELRHLQWVPMAEARALPLPFVTELVLAEVGEILRDGMEGRSVPYFNHGVSASSFRAID